MSFWKRYCAYLADNPRGYWFKNKVYGFGWVPVTWQGWVVIVVFVALLTLNALRIDSQAHSVSDSLITFLPETVLLLLVLFAICYVKGEPLKWQWGIPKKKE